MESTYKGFWKCRDLEIQMLWTRLTMLGTFMALTYTGYGVLLMKIGDKMPLWNVFHLLAIGMGCFGMLFSTLWILMAKGSKAWYEQYEAALKYFQKVNKDLFEKDADGDSIHHFSRKELDGSQFQRFQLLWGKYLLLDGDLLWQCIFGVYLQGGST